MKANLSDPGANRTRDLRFRNRTPGPLSLGGTGRSESNQDALDRRTSQPAHNGQLAKLNGRAPTREVCAARAHRHDVRAALLRHRILRGAVTLGGASDMATAMRMLSVLSREGQLDGFRIVTREARR